MKILILREFNMFVENSASANRWRTIVEGLTGFDVEILMLFISGYKSVIEKKQYGKQGKINHKIRYSYLSSQNNYSYWPARINKYLLSKLYVLLGRYMSKKIIDRFIPDIVLLSPGLEVFRLITGAIKTNSNEFKLAIELNEFNDLGDVHITNWFQKHHKNSYNSYLKDKIFPKVDLCLVMTDVLMKHFSQFPNLKNDISFLKVPMTVDIDRFTSERSEPKYHKPYVAYCGTSSFLKDGVDILIKSFSAISERYPKVHLYIAAYWHKDGPKMLELISSSGFKDRIFYLGTLIRDEIPLFLKNASLLALPRPDSLQARGGFPTKLGEYLATGVPTCVTKIGEIPQYLIDNHSAFMAEPGDIESFADALDRGLKDEANAKQVGLNGKIVAKTKFSMNVQAESIHAFFKMHIG